MQAGVLVPQGWRMDLVGVDGAEAKWKTFTDVSRSLEDDGWESLWVYDHFHTFPRKRVEATFEAWTMMSTLAALTSKPRLGQLVTCVQYREPSYLAKIAACVDVASGGRLNVGVGSGWFAEEFGAYGYDFRTVRQRLERLEETLQILRLLWAEEVANFDGKHFKLEDIICEPKPVQSPRPQIWIGGRGPKVLLRIVAQYADVWNFNGSLSEFPEFLEILKGHCRDVGRDFDEITVTAMSGGIVYDSDEELDGFFERIAPQQLDRDNLMDFVSCKGSREQCAEYLRSWEKAGCDGMVFFFQDIASVGEGSSQAEVFKREVLPLL